MDRLPLNLTTEGREAVFNRQIADIERQGGNALQDALDRNTAAMQANTAAMQGQGQGNPGVPPALPVGGAGGPWRNGPQP